MAQKGNNLKKCLKNQFSELTLPGVEIISGPRGSLLLINRAAQHPYNEKSKILEILIFISFLHIPYIPFEGAIWNRFGIDLESVWTDLESVWDRFWIDFGGRAHK